MATWYGWAKVCGTWQRLTGPHPSLAEAGRALDAAVRERGLPVRTRVEKMRAALNALAARSR